MIKALVDAEIDGTGEGLNGKKINSDRVVVGGFSQGGAIALLSGLTKSPAVGGIIAMSTWLPLRAKLVAPLLPDHASTLPVFMAHGTADPIVKYSYGERSAKFIRAGDGGGAGLGLGPFRKGENGKWRGVWTEAYQGMPHSACPEEVSGDYQTCECSTYVHYGLIPSFVHLARSNTWDNSWRKLSQRYRIE